MKRVIASGLAAVLLLSGCQTGGSGGGGVVIVDNEPRTPTQWVQWMNAKLVQACGYQASAEFLLAVFGKAEFSTIISQMCHVVEASRLAGKRGRAAFTVVGSVAGVVFNPQADGRFVR